jgi:hypothetical protein
MHTPTAQLLDCVAALRDFPDHGVVRGDIGTVVEIYGEQGYEVEFPRQGREPAVFGVPQHECLPVHLGPAEPPIVGSVDVLWYWYDPNDDVLEVRLASKRGNPGKNEPTPDGMMLIRDGEHGAPIGLVVRGFWQRFGSGPRNRGELEDRVRGIAGRLAA